MSTFAAAAWSLALALGMQTSGAAQTQQTQTPPVAAEAQKAPAAKSDAPPPPPPTATPRYSVGPDDLLTITVFDEPDLTGKYRVDADGSITFPLIGRVQAAGNTIPVLQERIRSMLATGYIRYPQVRVEIEQYKSQSVYVIGEVRAPGKYTLTGSMSLIEALALAGSPTTAASNELIVVHPKKPGQGSQNALDADGDVERTPVNLKDVQLGKVGLDIVLQDGDTIYVPKAQIFYINGYVIHPGSYVLDPGMTVLQAISLEGGLSERGSDRGIKIVRMVTGKREEVDAKVTDLVQPNDTILVRQRFF
jgi:polysaccharide biosynthesis/export protein